MEMMAVVLAVLCSLVHGLTLEAPPVFYVKPTVPPTTECPSGESPCYSLQYYANHSSFTNNSRFLFLEGEHHLDSVVTICNVANLSLVGLSPEVEILCRSVPSGFRLEKFTQIKVENMAVTNCTGSEKTSFSLLNGSDVSLKHVTISTSRYGSGGLVAMNVLGAFSIFASTIFSSQNGLTFFTSHSGQVRVGYSFCDRVSHFNFSKSKLQGIELHIGMYCTGVQVLVDESRLSSGLRVDYSVLTNNSFLVSNSILSGELTFTACHGSQCGHSSLRCHVPFLKIANTNFNFSDITFDFSPADAKMCMILIEDSKFLSSLLRLSFSYDLRTRYNDTTMNAIIKNTSFVSNAVIKLMFAASSFVNCVFENNTGRSVVLENNAGTSAVLAVCSKVLFQGSNVFRNNSALSGAGVSLLQDSYIHFEPHTHILFEGNHADYVGGAIYIESTPSDTCFYHITDSPGTVTVDFVGNTADFGGSSLYGVVFNCCDNTSCTNFYSIFNTSNTETSPSALASDPQRVCLCDFDKLQPNSKCSLSSTHTYYISAFPGQVFPVRLAVVGEWFDGVVTGVVRAYFNYPINATVRPVQSSNDQPSCGNFIYSVNSTEPVVTFELTPERNFLKHAYYSEISFYEILYVTVLLLDCPLGFSLSPVTWSCVCDPRLEHSNIECNINDQSFSRPANTWIGFINESFGVVFHPHCPTGYCIPHDVSVTSNTSDSQCEPHRTGLLCGECEDGYSLTLGDQKCQKCSNIYLLLVLPFAVAGLLLVAVLFALNLTVTEGSINGLIFYANVMAMNHTTLFPGETTFPYAFLAWLNLDLGISTCLFNGMDGYAETWLQFVFPVYLWAIILVVVLFYKKFHANRLGGKNAVKVLATLLLLSYTKLQRTVVTILSFTWLEYPDGVVRYVWLYDANVEIFKGKHLYLGIVGILVLVFLIVPYTLCLAFFQQLQACSGRKLFQWVNKLKPVFDAYAGPYKDKYRFWTGMLLAVRTLLIILFTINTAGSVEINLLITLVVSCILLLTNSNGTYKKWPYNFLESFFYLQLVVFAGAFFYARSTNDGIAAVADTSIGLALAVFLAIVGYHVIRCLPSMKTHYYRLRGYTEADEDEGNVEYVHQRMLGSVKW